MPGLQCRWSVKAFLAAALLVFTLFLIFVSPSISHAQAVDPPETFFAVSFKGLISEAESFYTLATAFEKLIASIAEEKDDAPPADIQQARDYTEKLLEMNGLFQQSVKQKILEVKDDNDVKNFLRRDILANLQNANRQLERIKLNLRGSTISYGSISYQAERVKTSLEQVVDRLKKYGEQ